MMSTLPATMLSAKGSNLVLSESSTDGTVTPAPAEATLQADFAAIGDRS
jgi:hypothetical protein